MSIFFFSRLVRKGQFYTESCHKFISIIIFVVFLNVIIDYNIRHITFKKLHLFVINHFLRRMFTYLLMTFGSYPPPSCLLPTKECTNSVCGPISFLFQRKHPNGKCALESGKWKGQGNSFYGRLSTFPGCIQYKKDDIFNRVGCCFLI